MHIFDWWRNAKSLHPKLAAFWCILHLFLSLIFISQFKFYTSWCWLSAKIERSKFVCKHAKYLQTNASIQNFLHQSSLKFWFFRTSGKHIISEIFKLAKRPGRGGGGEKYTALSMKRKVAKKIKLNQIFLVLWGTTEGEHREYDVDLELQSQRGTQKKREGKRERGYKTRGNK